MVAAATAVALGMTVNTLWQADAARSRWTDTREVVITTGDLDTGRVIGAADVRTVELPQAAIPAGATTASVDQLVGATVNRPIYAGEVVVDGRLGPAGLGPVAARIPAGFRAVAVPTGSAGSPAGTGRSRRPAGGGRPLWRSMVPQRVRQLPRRSAHRGPPG